LKHDKKTLQEKLDRKTSLVDKETMTHPINLTTQKEANPADVKKFSNVEVQTSQRYEKNSIPKVNQEKTTSIRSKYQIVRMPYQHPNHKNRYLSNPCINRNKWPVCQRILLPLQAMLKIEVIMGVEIHQVLSKNPINSPCRRSN